MDEEIDLEIRYHIEMLECKRLFQNITWLSKEEEVIQGNGEYTLVCIAIEYIMHKMWTTSLIVGLFWGASKMEVNPKYRSSIISSLIKYTLESLFFRNRGETTLNIFPSPMASTTHCQSVVVPSKIWGFLKGKSVFSVCILSSFFVIVRLTGDFGGSSVQLKW